jgi:hypothetical protein
MKPTFRIQDVDSSPQSQYSAMSPLSTMTALTPISPFTFLYLQNFPTTFQGFSVVAEAETRKADEIKPVKCGCRRTKCLKLYCDCFASGNVCSEDCECKGCHNNEEFKEEREEVVLKTKTKNPAAFRVDISANYKICHCNKSNCLKRYCECFQNGRTCGVNCRCKHCKNVDRERH